MINKIYKDVSQVVADITNDCSIMIGGFGLCGNPENLILELHKKKTKNITLISNNCGTSKLGIGILLQNKQIRKVVASYVGENSEFERQFLHGDIEAELIPQGTLAEKIRCGRAGIPAFYTQTGINTLAEGGLPIKYSSSGDIVKKSKTKETKIFNQKK